MTVRAHRVHMGSTCWVPRSETCSVHRWPSKYRSSCRLPGSANQPAATAPCRQLDTGWAAAAGSGRRARFGRTATTTAKAAPARNRTRAPTIARLTTPTIPEPTLRPTARLACPPWALPLSGAGTGRAPRSERLPPPVPSDRQGVGRRATIGADRDLLAADRRQREAERWKGHLIVGGSHPLEVDRVPTRLSEAHLGLPRDRDPLEPLHLSTHGLKPEEQAEREPQDRCHHCRPSRKRTRRPRSSSTSNRLRACWVTQRLSVRPVLGDSPPRSQEPGGLAATGETRTPPRLSPA
jgi:hypothetical protein